MAIILPDASPARLPPVVIEFVHDDANDIRIARAEQHWFHTEHGVIPIEMNLPVRDGVDVLIPDEAARRYIIKWMNMKAKRLVAAGFTPRLKTQIESALMEFAQPIARNGKVKGVMQ